ncbi:MAG: protein kinase [Planctomycetota bacterium]
MTSDDLYTRAKRAFLEVCDAEPSERASLLERLCADDHALRAEVLSLLSHDLDDGAFGDHLPSGATVGGFEICGVLGEGAMGVVYEARQKQPPRPVALKVVRGGAAPASLRRRLEHESAALARLQHPGIAAVYEAGIDRPTGAPFFAMELVRGRPITVPARTMPIEDRVELLAQIADAVQHAHQRGVIHRDLKPGNILLDEQGRPKILDFGIARLTAEGDAAMTLRTLPGQVVGTLAYMSPEQAAGDPASIDARSDVYSLGALGYELLSGVVPIDVANKPLPEALRAVQQDEPRMLGSLDRTLRGDLETIIGRALEKEADHRYTSAAAFADDLRRALRHEPIEARPATTMYQFRKFARRRKGLVTTIGLVAAALVLGTTFSIAFAVQASQQRTLADRRFADVRAIANTMLFELHDSIETVPGAIDARRQLVETGLDYLGRLAQDAGDDPVLLEELAEAYFRIGDIQGNPHRANLGDPEAAIDSYERSIELRQRLLAVRPSEEPILAVARTQLAIAEAMTSTPRADDAAAELELSIATIDGLDSEQAENLRVMVEQRLGTKLINMGRPDEALEHFRLAIEASERLASSGDADKLRRLTIGLNGLGLTLVRVGRPEEALPYLDRSMEIRSETLRQNPESTRARRDVALVHHRMGDVRRDLDQVDVAIGHFRAAREILSGIAQADNADARAQFDRSVADEKLANVLLDAGLTEEARTYFANARDARQQLAIENPENRLYAMAAAIAVERVAHSAGVLGDYSAARADYASAIEIAQRGIAETPDDVRLWTVLGVAQHGMARSLLDSPDTDPDQARSWVSRSMETLEQMRSMGMKPTRSTLNDGSLAATLARCDAG